MGINLQEFEVATYKMFTGNLSASPFKAEEIAKGKTFMIQWCKVFGVGVRSEDRAT